MYAFEPDLEFAARALGVCPNFMMLPIAVVSEDGCGTLGVNRCRLAGSSLPGKPLGVRSWTGGEDLVVERTTVVPTTRIDTFMNAMEIARVDYLKL